MSLARVKTGGVLWNVLHSFPAITPSSPSPFVVVGMMALFGGIAKVPLAVILMVSEMTMDYTLLIPSMLTCSVAYFSTGDNYIYEKQVAVRAQSPAHQHDYLMMNLKSTKVKDAMMNNVRTVRPQQTVSEVADILKNYKIHAVPVVDDGKLIGIIAKREVIEAISDKQSNMPAVQIMSSKLVLTYPDESLFDAMNKMINSDIGQLPVVERNRPDQLVGLLAIDDVDKKSISGTSH